MKPSRPSAGPPSDDLAEAAFLDDAERAESAWLLARDGDPAAPPPSPQLARDYAELEDLLGDLPRGVAAEGWHDEVLRAVPASERARAWWRGHRLRWALGGAVVAAAAITVLVVIPRSPAAELQVAIRHPGATRSDPTEAVVGDQLVVRTPSGGARELRVFRSDGTLVARCPHGPACSAPERGDHVIELTLDAPIQYQVILVVGMTGASPDAAMDAYLDAARAANARVVTYPPIVVH